MNQIPIKGEPHVIAIIDYGVGNLYSISHSLSSLGLENAVTRDERTILNAES